jgi:hypothetical protein
MIYVSYCEIKALIASHSIDATAARALRMLSSFDFL